MTTIGLVTSASVTINPPVNLLGSVSTLAYQVLELAV
jgi:hypothetical protein